MDFHENLHACRFWGPEHCSAPQNLQRCAKAPPKQVRVCYIYLLTTKWSGASKKNIFEKVLRSYKAYHLFPVPLFKEYFKFQSKVHRYKTTGSSDFVCSLNPRSNYGYATFYYKSLTEWNKLSQSVKEAPTLGTFKKLIFDRKNQLRLD
jgi:hypothetical protein